MTNLYTCDAIQELANHYINHGGEVYEIEEGVLGWGVTVMFADGYKTAVVKEVAVNPWSSGHTVRMYNKTPKKYAKILGR